MQLIPVQLATEVVKSGLAGNYRVVRAGDGGWCFTFDLPNPDSGHLQMFSLRTSRGSKLRTWSDAGRLFLFLETRLGITAGQFHLEEANGK